MDGGSAPLRPFDPDVLARTGEPIEAAIAAGDLAGAVTLIWRRGEAVQTRALGRRDIGRDLPMERDTLFRIASMTKPVTSVAALMLIEEGRMALEDPITRWLPEFADMRVLKDPVGPLEDTTPAPRDITVEDLFTHRAGLAYGFTSQGPIAHAHERALGDVLNTDTAPDAWLAALGGLPLTFAPGARLHYSHATDVLGFLAARVGGTDLRSLLFERIFDPLGMKDTDFYTPPAKRDRAAVVYRNPPEGGPLEPVPFRLYDTPPRFCGGGGGLISTADDYLRFARMLLGGGAVDGVRLLRPETVAMMTANRLTDAQRGDLFLGMPLWLGQGFGLGVSMILEPEKHAWMGAGSTGAFGWPGAFGTWWQADPAEDMVAIYLIQDSMPLGPEAVTQIASSRGMGARLALPQFQKLLYAALGK